MSACGCNNFPASLGNVTFEGSVGIGPNVTTQISTLDVSEGLITAQSLIESQGYSDVALGAPISFTGGALGSGGGPTLTGHQSFWQASSTGQQMTVDRGGIVDFITGISFGAYQRGDIGSMPLAYAIDYSTDDLNWTNIATVTKNAQTSVIHLGFSVTARCIRLTINAF